MVPVKLLHPRATADMAGLIPEFLSPTDPRSAKDQLHANYTHGGGWRPFSGFTYDPEANTINYPEDEPIPAICEMSLRDERIILFSHSWVMILQPDGSHEIARMD